MRRPRVYIILLILSIIITCCNNRTSYLKDASLSNKDGFSIDSSASYLPIEPKNYMDSDELKWYTSTFHYFNEPIFYNYYLGKESYRFFWLRSFHRPILITIECSDKVILKTKILSKIPENQTYIYVSNYGPNKTNGIILEDIVSLNSLRNKYPEADSIVLPPKDIKIAIDTTSELSFDQWKTFKSLVQNCNFWTLNSKQQSTGLDGAEWILEGQTQKHYKFVDRWSPNNSFAECCKYLINLSAAKNEEIY